MMSRKGDGLKEDEEKNDLEEGWGKSKRYLIVVVRIVKIIC